MVDIVAHENLNDPLDKKDNYREVFLLAYWLPVPAQAKKVGRILAPDSCKPMDYALTATRSLTSID